MTLVIAGTNEAGQPYVLSDSLLTADVRGSDGGRSTHLIERAIKTYVIRYRHLAGQTSTPVDISVGIAGNISLGLQSLLFVEARLRTPRRASLNSDELREVITNDLTLFWRAAADRTVQYACAWSHPAEGRTQLFKAFAGPGHHGELVEVRTDEPAPPLVIIGDEADAAEREIRREAMRACYTHASLSPHTANFASSVRVLRRWMKDANRPGVGGTIQAVLTLTDNPPRAQHVSILTNERYSFRGVDLDALEEPGTIGEGEATIALDNALWDPEVDWADVEKESWQAPE